MTHAEDNAGDGRIELPDPDPGEDVGSWMVSTDEALKLLERLVKRAWNKRARNPHDVATQRAGSWNDVRNQVYKRLYGEPGRPRTGDMPWEKGKRPRRPVWVTWDPSKKTWSDYFSWRVQHIIQDEFREYERDAEGVTFSRQLIRYQVERVRWREAHDGGGEPPDSVMAELLGVRVKRIEEIKKVAAARRVTSLDEIFETAASDGAFALVEFRVGFLDQLDEDDRLVWELDLEGLTQREIAERLGTNPMNVNRRLDRLRGEAAEFLGHPIPGP